jgi:hypothetical protein
MNGIVAPIVSLLLIALALYVCFNPWVLTSAGQSVARLAAGQTGLLFQRINRTDPEKVFVTVFNTYSTAAMSNGQAVQWDYPTDKDGLGVTRPTARATSAGMAGAGIIAEAIAAGSYGLMQVYGIHSAVRARTVTGGTPAIVAGRPLVMPVAGAVFCVESVATASTVILTFPIGFAFGTTTGFTTAAIAAFIRAL